MILGLPMVDSVLERHADRIASDLPAYRNHVYRIVNLMDAIAPIEPANYTAVGAAAVFHDIGLWTAGTWDYLPPSMALAEQWLQDAALPGLVPLVRGMIENHHKILCCRGGTDPLIENFRRADWCDVTHGFRPCGISRRRYREILCLFPACGFHRRLLSIAFRHVRKRPLHPFPMLRL